MRRLILWLVTGVLAVAIPVGAEWRRTTARVPVDVAVISADSIHLTLTATGTLAPSIIADVGSRVTGTLVDLRVIEGQSVLKGMILGRIAPEAGVSMRESARGATLDAEARVASAEASLRQEERKLKRLRDIAAGAVSGTLVSTQELEAAASAVELARSSVDGARAALVTAGASALEADNATQRVLLVAPFDGVVTRIHKRMGETVVPATYGGESGRVLSVARPERGKVTINVPERYALQMDARDPIRAALLADPTRNLRMVVSRVRPRQVASGALSGFEADLTVEPTKGPFPWGATVLVQITVVAERAGRVVPLAALTPDPDDAAGTGIFLLEDGRARFRRVRVAQFGDVSASLADGPPAGSTVILPPTDGIAVIVDGTRVLAKPMAATELPRRRTP